MVLSCHSLRVVKPVIPFVERQVNTCTGMSYGLSHCGYDVRLAYLRWPGSVKKTEDIWLLPGDFILASTLEQFIMPNDVVGVVHDKSTWARKGLAVQNTVIEPGWRGFLTLEISNHGPFDIQLKAGYPICQIMFHKLDHAVNGYSGKYQDQPNEPVEARREV